MPIRLRLALVYALAASLLLAGGGYVFVRQLHAGLLAPVDTGLRTRADQLAQTLRQAEGEVEFQDERTRLLAPRESFAQVVGADGRVIDASEAIGPRPLLTARQRAQAKGGSRFFNGRRGGERVRLLAAPVQRADGVWLAVAGSSLEPTERALGRVRVGLAVAGAVIAVLGGLGSWLLAGAALRPVERMRRQAAAMSERDPGQLETPATRDEVAALASTLNDLLARLKGSLARERRLVADASHELRTPLAVLRTELELARRPGRTREQLLEALGNAAEEAERLSRLAQDLLVLVQSDEGLPLLHRVAQPVRPVLQRSVDAAAEAAGRAGVEVRLTVPARLEAEIDPDRVRQAVDNLLANALRVSPVDSVIEVEGRADGPFVVIEVRDVGPGFPSDFLPYAFDRFRRADPARTRRDGGAGLGLAIVRAIAEAHGGRAEASNVSGGGASVRLVLPTRRPRVGAPPADVEGARAR